ncbi:MAG: hypothetical protein LBD32_02610 [Cytophagales bacterium]|nr:hypothetical protein [Cytophagales bacterium]
MESYEESEEGKWEKKRGSMMEGRESENEWGRRTKLVKGETMTEYNSIFEDFL